MTHTSLSIRAHFISMRLKRRNRVILIIGCILLWVLTNILWNSVYNYKVVRQNRINKILGPYRDFIEPEIFFPEQMIDMDKKNSSPPFYEKRSHPKIIFIKTMKTGSTAIQNLLFRISDKYNMKIAFPKSARYDNPSIFSPNFVRPDSFGIQQPFDETLVYPKPDQVDVLLHRMKYNWENVNKIFENSHFFKPKKPTFTFTILRHPYSVLSSVFQDYSYDISSFKKFGDFNDFLSSNPASENFDTTKAVNKVYIFTKTIKISDKTVENMLF